MELAVVTTNEELHLSKKDISLARMPSANVKGKICLEGISFTCGTKVHGGALLCAHGGASLILREA